MGFDKPPPWFVSHESFRELIKLPECFVQIPPPWFVPYEPFRSFWWEQIGDSWDTNHGEKCSCLCTSPWFVSHKPFWELIKLPECLSPPWFVSHEPLSKKIYFRTATIHNCLTLPGTNANTRTPRRCFYETGTDKLGFLKWFIYSFWRQLKFWFVRHEPWRKDLHFHKTFSIINCQLSIEHRN